MKTKFPVLIQIIVITFLILGSCNFNRNEDGSLDDVKNYVPEDKYFKSSLKSLHFVIETDAIEDVDKLFSRMIEQYSLPVDARGIRDGRYTGESPFDAFDYKHVIELTVKDKRISKVHYNEEHRDGSNKRTDVGYNKEMSVTGTSPSIAYPLMEEQLIEKQNILHVDATSGATYSLYRLRYAATLSLMKARLEANE